jgi:hypothetical protein
MELLRQFGRPGLAYSGAQSALKPLIQKAPLFALPPEKVPGAYVRDNSRLAPHNLYLNPDKVLSAAPKADKVTDIGFRFGAAPEGGRQVNEHIVHYQVARFGFMWSNSAKRWLVSMDGTASRTSDGKQLGASTVVVQDVDLRPSKFKDRWGNTSPSTATVGSGTAKVLRDGKLYEARWSRPTAGSGTTFTTLAGQPLDFAPGQVWVVLNTR